MLPPVFALRRRFPLGNTLPWLVVAGLDFLTVVTGGWIGIRWPHDWGVFESIPRHLADGSLYQHALGYNFAWSPAAAWIIMLFVLPLGFHLWFILHAVSLALLRDSRLIALAACSIAVLIDAGLGNTVAFVFVAGVLALRGSRIGELVYLALFVLVPRPMALPLAAWLLWRQPRTRLPFVAMAGVVAVTALASGYAVDWLNAATAMAASHAGGDANAGPTRLFGQWWMLIGVPLAVWLTMHRQVGLAGMAITPYLFPQYLILALWDVVDHRRRVIEGHAVQVGDVAGPVDVPVMEPRVLAPSKQALAREPATLPRMGLAEGSLWAAKVALARQRAGSADMRARIGRRLSAWRKRVAQRSWARARSG